MYFHYFYVLIYLDKHTSPDGIWYDGKTNRHWGHIENTTLEWWDGVKSKIILEKPNYILLPLQKGMLKGHITGKGLIEWEDRAIWRLGNE